MRLRLPCLAALGLVLALGGTSRANLIQNGSFEVDKVTAANSVGTQYAFAPPLLLPSWTVTKGSVDIDVTAPTFGAAATNGVQNIDLDGNSPGALQQGFATVVGGHYVLSFDLSTNIYANQTEGALVTVGDLSTTVTHVATTYGNLAWTHIVLGFKATGTTSILAFTSTSTGGSTGVLIDNVSVVPEPASLAMCATALAGLTGAAARRKRKAKAKSA